MKFKFRLISLLITMVLLVGFSTTVTADDGKPISDDDVNKIASQLYCPICENVPLDVCPSQACADWRELVRQFLAEGKNEEEIKAYFSTQYGWSVLAIPPKVGLNWLIYILPPLIVIAGILAVVTIQQKSKQGNPIEPKASEGSHSESNNKYLSIIDRDLKNEE